MSECIRPARTATKNGVALTPFENSKAQARLPTTHSKHFPPDFVISSVAEKSRRKPHIPKRSTPNCRKARRPVVAASFRPNECERRNLSHCDQTITKSLSPVLSSLSASEGSSTGYFIPYFYTLFIPYSL
jgi:hypothetical protein